MNESGSRLRNILKSYRFSIILLTGVVAGALLGVVLGEKTAVLQPFADIFLNMVVCLIVPGVVISRANSIANMGHLGTRGQGWGV